MAYPRLAALRAQRERQEAEIAAPYLNSMMRAQREAAAERRAREGLERIMASKVSGPLLEHLSHAMAEGVQRHIMESVRKAYAGAGGLTGVVQLEFLADELRWGIPSTMARTVLDEFKRDCGPKMRFHAIASEADMMRRVTTVQVSLPELHYRHQMMDDKVW